MALDGSCMDVADEAANARYFGYPGASRGQSAFPQARVPGLVDLLREEFAMPVEELNPFRKVLINPGKHSEDQIRELAPRLVVAVGLALRSFD